MLIKNKREEITLHAQLQQQFDTIEILPPAKDLYVVFSEFLKLKRKPKMKTLKPTKIKDYEGWEVLGGLQDVAKSIIKADDLLEQLDKELGLE